MPSQIANFRAGCNRLDVQAAADQDYYDRLGKTFVYMIAPTKPATYPEGLPPETDCPAPLADRAGKSPAFRRILDSAGIRYLDATALVEKYRNAFPVPLFPRGGTHWGEIGAGFEVEAFAADLAKWAPAARLPPFEVAFSYLGFNDVLRQIPCRPVIDYFYYYRRSFLDYADPSQHYHKASVDPALRRRDLTGGADIVLLEETDLLVPGSLHAEALYDLLIENRDTP